MNILPLRCVGDDSKKRPLSLTSTSSSGSFSSHSLSRHLKKKLAHEGSEGNCTGDSDFISENSSHVLNSSSDPSLNISSHPECHETLVSVLPSYDNLSGYGSDSLTDQGADRGGDDFSKLTEISRNEYVQNVVSEMLKTEELYVKELLDIVQGYTIPLYSYMGLNEEVHKEIFGNIIELYDFNRKLLNNLTKCSSVSDISRVFTNHAGEFLLYTFYCSNYPRSVEVINNCFKNSSEAEFLTNLQAKLSHKLPLASYLLKPIQRIFKYHLFLQNILRKCEKEEEERVREAFDSMRRVLEHINQTSQLVNKNTFKPFQVDDRKTCPQDLGELILKDKLLIDNLPNKDCLHIFLFSRAVLIAGRKNRNKFLVKVLFKAKEAWIVEDVCGPSSLSFFLVSSNQPHFVFRFTATNAEQKTRWCRQLRNVLANNSTMSGNLLVHIRETLKETCQKKTDEAKVNTHMKQGSKKLSDHDKSQQSAERSYMTIEQIHFKQNLPNVDQENFNGKSQDGPKKQRGKITEECRISFSEFLISPFDSEQKYRYSLDELKRISCPNEISTKLNNSNWLEDQCLPSKISNKTHACLKETKSCSRSFGPVSNNLGISDSPSKKFYKSKSSGKQLERLDNPSDANIPFVSPRNPNYLFTLKVSKSKREKLMLGYKEAKCKDVVLEGCSGVYRKLPEAIDPLPVNPSPFKKVSEHDHNRDEPSPSRDDSSESSFCEMLDFYYEDRLLDDLEGPLLSCNESRDVDEEACFSLGNDNSFNNFPDQTFVVNPNFTSFISGSA